MAQAISQDDYLNDTSQFDVARKRAAEQSAVSLQARRDALARRFASLGNLDSGARIKQEELASQDEASNLANANEGINAQQQAELGRRREVIQGQQFQSGEAEKARGFGASEAEKARLYGTSEREAGQKFSGEQSAMQRAFLRSEREGGQDFASSQAALQRAYGTSEREAGQKFATSERGAGQQFSASEAQKQRDVQAEQFAKTYGLSLEQFKAAQEQFRQTFGEEARVNDANISFGQQALDKKGVLEQLGSNLSMGNITGKVGNGFSSIGNGFGQAIQSFGNFVSSPSSWF